MTYIISQPATFHLETIPIERKSALRSFIQWATDQERYHIAWVGVSIMVMSAVIFPLTMAAILLNGAVFSLIITAIVSLALVVITNLAAMSTRYTIPFLML